MTLTPHEGSELALTPDQRFFTPAQVAGLVHIGIEGASEPDLAVFFHQCKTRGLDPFVKQIHMIARSESYRDDNEPSGWGKRVKWTIQTGIDGFRLIARRAARQSHDTVSISEPAWKRRDTGEWVDAWDRQWGLPLAAKVTVYRAGQPFPATAQFDEYVQLKSGGRLTATWDQRPAGQLEKCAEALAWRKAFPEDLSGLYIDEEMDHADNPQAQQTSLHDSGERITADAIRSTTPGVGGDDPTRKDETAAGGGESSAPGPDDDVHDAVLGITDAQSREIGELLQYIGITQRKKAVEYLNDCLPEGRTVRARADLTTEEAEGVLLALRDDKTKKDAGAAEVATTADPAVDQPADPWANVEVKQPPADKTE